MTIEGYFLGYASPKKHSFNFTSGRAKEWYHVNFHTLHNLLKRDFIGCLIMMVYLFKSFTRSVEVPTRDLVRAYPEEQMYVGF